MADLVAPFKPAYNATVAASNTSAFAVLGQGETVMVFNASNSTAFLAWGIDNTVTATTANFAVPAGSTRMLNIGLTNGQPLYVAVILASGSGNIYVSSGTGSLY